MINRTILGTTAAVLFSASAMISFTANADESKIVERVKPVGHLVILTKSETAKSADATTNTKPAAATTTANTGKSTYNTACFACHGTGAAGAPILGKKDAWVTRISQGKDTLYSHALKGFNAMPAKGGSTSLSDDKVKAVVDYMVEQSS